MLDEKLARPAHRGVPELRTLPWREHFDVRRPLQIGRNFHRVYDIVTWHQKDRNVAGAHELARHAENEIAAKHPLSKPGEQTRVDVRPAPYRIYPKIELVVERRAVCVGKSDRILQYERRYESRARSGDVQRK